jgi:hypothetical protein
MPENLKNIPKNLENLYKLKVNKGSLFPLQRNISLLISPIIPCCPVSAELLRFSQMPRTILLACDTISGVVFASV